nr:S-type pyocin domain-containing protein [Pseudomonas sp. 21LCFQ02]
MVGISALVYSSKLGDGELSSRYSFTIPLSELNAPTLSEFKSGAVKIPIRLDFRMSTADQVEIVAVATDLLSESSSLRVIAAKYDSERKVYTASTPDVPGRNLIWTPIVEPGDSSTARPVDSFPGPVYEGAALVPLDGRVDTYPELADAEIDDYIFVFPADSGLPPLYVVFRSPRNMPGTVSGEGQSVQGGWLSSFPERNGSPVPARIANQLRGMRFNNFSRFREAFWRLVAADEVLGKQFIPSEISRMKQGYAPVVPENQRSGARQVFEIHHIEFISNGGAVYDVDNLIIMTPKGHIKLHAEVKRG